MECRRLGRGQGEASGVLNPDREERTGGRNMQEGQFDAKALCLSTESAGQGRAKVDPALSSNVGD